MAMGSGVSEIKINDRGLVKALNRSMRGVATHTRMRLEEIGGLLARGQKERLLRSGKVDRGANGGLLSAIGWDIKGTRGQMELIVGPTALGDSHAVQALTIDEGRSPGKPMPPAGAIHEWAARHGIPEEAEFPIRRAIGIQGLSGQPFPFIDPSGAELAKADETLGMILDDVMGDLES